MSQQILLTDKEEIRKCKESPLYAYNKYFKPKEQEDWTQEKYDAFFIDIRDEIRQPLVLGDRKVAYPFMPKESFQKLPPFCK